MRGSITYLRKIAKNVVRSCLISMIPLTAVNVYADRFIQIPYLNGYEEHTKPYVEPYKIFIFHLNLDAQVQDFKTILEFLNKSESNRRLYIPNFVCVDFAHALVEEAHQKRIYAEYVDVAFDEGCVGHALVAFPTTDRGIVYVDFTASETEYFKKIVFLKEDRFYLSFSLSSIDANFANTLVDFKHRQFIRGSFEQKIREKFQYLKLGVDEYNKIRANQELELRRKELAAQNYQLALEIKAMQKQLEKLGGPNEIPKGLGSECQVTRKVSFPQQDVYKHFKTAVNTREYAENAWEASRKAFETIFGRK